jgi:hypothetical protein
MSGDGKQACPRAPAHRRDRTRGAGFQAILGIDAAWTLTQPTGIAVIARENSGWRLVSAEPSVTDFLGEGWRVGETPRRPRGSQMIAATLLERAEELAGIRISLARISHRGGVRLLRAPVLASWWMVVKRS